MVNWTDHMAVCLIVDDSLVARLVARKAVSSLGFAIREAADGGAGLQACSRSMPDAILVDWNMPGMNGMDFLRGLRAMPGGELPVVILSTTEDDPRHIQSAMRLGADACVVKPLNGGIIQKSFAAAGLIGTS